MCDRQDQGLCPTWMAITASYLWTFVISLEDLTEDPETNLVRDKFSLLECGREHNTYEPGL